MPPQYGGNKGLPRAILRAAGLCKILLFQAYIGGNRRISLRLKAKPVKRVYVQAIVTLSSVRNRSQLVL